MHRDASELTSGESLASEVAVVGAGPLGIVLAFELAASGKSVILLESGGMRYAEPAQRLGDAASEDRDYYHVRRDLAVRRQVGGTSTLWGGRCVPFDRVDFEGRPAQPGRLWPVGYDEVVPYLDRACAWFRCGRSIWNAHQLPELEARYLIPGLPDGDVRTSDLERWSLPTRFGSLYGAALKQHPRIELLTGVTCTEILTDEGGSRVRGLKAASLDGRTFRITAQHYALAGGGLETTRLLLASDQHHPGGVGNHSDHLGRWYMGHVEGRFAELHLTTPADETIYDHERDADGVYVRRRFTLSEDLQRREALPNAAVWLVNPDLGDPSHGSGILSGVYLTLISPLGRFMLAEAIRRAGTKTVGGRHVKAHLWNILTDFGSALRFALSFTYRRFLRRGRKAPGFFVRSAANVYPLHYHGEHLPHWDSRVELSDECDALGMRRLRTRMRYTDEDRQGVVRVLLHLDRHLRSHNVGRIEYLTGDVEGSIEKYMGGSAGYHQTGTTRMSERPEDGVVDQDLQVHGTENLHVASTSVFPTSSQANPTLMGVAFAIRLADRLRCRLEPTCEDSHHGNS